MSIVDAPWWFFHSSVGVEGSQLLLHALQRVGKLSVIEHLNGVTDPFQQVSGQGLVVIDHAVMLQALVHHL